MNLLISNIEYRFFE